MTRLAAQPIVGPEPPFQAEFKKAWRAYLPKIGKLNRRIARGDAHFGLLDHLDLVFSRIPDAVIRRHCPPWCLVPEASTTGAVRLRWRCLESQLIKGQRVMYSKRRRTIEIQGGHWLIGWTKHAIDRLFERVVDGRVTFNALNYVFATIDGDDCHSYTLSELPSKQGDTVLDCWYLPAENSVSEVIVRACCGGMFLSNYQVLGVCCPLAFHGKFALALTALAPSMLVYSSTDPRSRLLDWSDRDEQYHKDATAWADRIHELHQRKPLVRRCV